MQKRPLKRLWQFWLCIPFVIAGCQSYKPTESNMVGLWIVDDALAKRTPYRVNDTKMQIFEDHTFVCTNLDPSLILTGPASRSSTLLEETFGTWIIVKEGYLEGIYLNAKSPKHSHALTGIPSLQDGHVLLRFTSFSGPLYFKKDK